MDGEVAGAVEGGAVAAEGDLGSEGVEGGDEIGDELSAVGKRGGLVGADE